MFLSEAELIRYTGYKQPAAQIRFLQSRNIRHEVSRLGRPTVTWDAVNGHEKPRVGPNFAALKKTG